MNGLFRDEEFFKRLTQTPLTRREAKPRQRDSCYSRGAGMALRCRVLPLHAATLAPPQKLRHSACTSLFPSSLPRRRLEESKLEPGPRIGFSPRSLRTRSVAVTQNPPRQSRCRFVFKGDLCLGW